MQDKQEATAHCARLRCVQMSGAAVPAFRTPFEWASEVLGGHAMRSQRAWSPWKTKRQDNGAPEAAPSCDKVKEGGSGTINKVLGERPRVPL